MGVGGGGAPSPLLPHLGAGAPQGALPKMQPMATDLRPQQPGRPAGAAHQPLPRGHAALLRLKQILQSDSGGTDSHPGDARSPPEQQSREDAAAPDAAETAGAVAVLPRELLLPEPLAMLEPRTVAACQEESYKQLTWMLKRPEQWLDPPGEREARRSGGTQQQQQQEGEGEELPPRPKMMRARGLTPEERIARRKRSLAESNKRYQAKRKSEVRTEGVGAVVGLGEHWGLPQ
jgi:hypothetical protein